VSRSDDLRLLDIIEASERIARIIARGRGAFREDEAVQPALERLLEVIGESANAMSVGRTRDSPRDPGLDAGQQRTGAPCNGDYPISFNTGGGCGTLHRVDLARESVRVH
jgi:hypothetical protein